MIRLLLVFFLDMCLCYQREVPAEERLDLTDAVVSQVGIWNNHHPGLAVDGNIRSYSVACARCDENNPTDVIGWFRIDFNHDVDIARVELINSHHYPDSNYLQEINVGVASKPGKYFDDYEKCGEHDNRGVSLPSNTRIVIECSRVLRGRSVMIWKKPNALVRPDAISIAEINLFTGPGDRYSDDDLPYDEIPYGKGNRIYYENHPGIRNHLPSGKTVEPRYVTQSSSYGNHLPKLAIDGDQDTYSIAVGVSNQDWLPAWWQADLGKSYHVTGLTIISSPDYTNAQYLKKFKVLVSQLDYIQDPDFRRSYICVEINDSGMVPTRSLRALTCLRPIMGRYVIILAADGPMSLAEVEIYVIKVVAMS